MSRRIALKRLTASDLSFFRWHFENTPTGGNQKSINLNRGVFIDQLYPALPDAPQALSGRLPIDLYLYGPGLTGELNIQRKIIKGGSYKNWRLNGEFVQEQQQRFEPLAPDDFVLLEFIGEIVPDQARALFVAKAVAQDMPLYNVMSTFLPAAPRAMRTVTVEQLTDLLRAATGLATDHPAHEFMLDADLEDAAQGGQQGIIQLRRRRARRTITLDDLRRARVRAEQNGERGEHFVNEYLDGRLESGTVTGYTWVSLNDPLAPYDFEVSDPAGDFRLDVKATDGEFDRRIHVSYGELQAMTELGIRYDLYRVFNMDGDTASLRVAADMREWGKRVLSTLGDLEAGVGVDGVSVDPRTLHFAEVINLRLTEEV